jgi:hypothetical protein
MVRQNKAQRNINRTVRMTPYDAKVAGTFAEKPRSEKAPPRKATPAEVRANNRSMVELGRTIADLEAWIPFFRSELDDMNHKKVGRPFEFPDSMIWWIMRHHAANDSTFRLTAGQLHALLEHAWGKAISYSSLNERANAIAGTSAKSAVKIKKEYGQGVISVHVCRNAAARTRRAGIDSTGLNMSSTNLWRSIMWKTGPKYKGWLKLHALCDVDTGEILAYAVTDETVGDAPLLKLLVEKAMGGGHVFGKVYADGAYSSDENWIFLCREKNLAFVTSFKVNTVPKNRGSLERGDAARLWCSLPYDEWVKASGYGTRWKCECVFSDFKRIFPETVTARTLPGILCQIYSRVGVFNEFKGIRARIMKITGNGVPVA